jgi:hypothetical protein
LLAFLKTYSIQNSQNVFISSHSKKYNHKIKAASL